MVSVMAVDWTAELVLESENDARKCIPMVSEQVCGMKALKIDMVICPAGTVVPKFKRDGADMTIYVVAGQGTLRAGGRDLPLKPGDIAYVPDGEWN